jgi:hypothetical protein
VLDFLVGMGARNDLKPGVCRAGLFNQIAGLEGVRDRADEPLRTGEIGSFQEAGLSCVAGDDFDAPRAEPVDDVLTFLDD